MSRRSAARSTSSGSVNAQVVTGPTLPAATTVPPSAIPRVRRAPIAGRLAWQAAWNTRTGTRFRRTVALVPRSPLALAALASVAVPGLDVYDVLRSPHSDADFDVVIIKDATGKRWIVRAPKRAAAGAALEAEMGLLHALGQSARRGAHRVRRLPPQGRGARWLAKRAAAPSSTPRCGAPRSTSLAVEPGPGLAASIGRAIAQIHELPPSLVEDQGLPTYDADEYRLTAAGRTRCRESRPAWSLRASRTAGSTRWRTWPGGASSPP